MTEINTDVLSEIERWESIRAADRHFDMDAEDLSDNLLAMGGRSHITPEADLAANGNAIDASEALAAKELHNNSALMGLIENWKTRLASYTEKSESATTGLGKEKRSLTGEERLTFLNRAVELKLVLADIGNLIADAASYEPTTQEKLLGAKPAGITVVPPAAPKSDVSELLEPTLSTQEQRDQNAKRAALFIQNAKQADQFFRDHPVKRE